MALKQLNFYISMYTINLFLIMHFLSDYKSILLSIN